MANAPRALIALLLGTVAFFALWTFALKGGSSSGVSGTSKKDMGVYQSAIAKAHQAVTTSNLDNERQGGTIAQPTPHTSTAASKPAVAPAKAAPATRQNAAPTTSKAPVAPGAATKARVKVVTAALRDHKVVALLFYNPGASDDDALKAELAGVPTHHGAVVKLAAPIGELSSYPVVTNSVPVVVSPTLVLIDSHQQASTIVGFADKFEIAQRVADLLAAK